MFESQMANSKDKALFTPHRVRFRCRSTFGRESSISERNRALEIDAASEAIVLDPTMANEQGQTQNSVGS